MSPEWILAGSAVVGLIGNAVWSAVNLRIENRVLKLFAEQKEWTLEHFELKASSPLTGRAARAAH